MNESSMFRQEEKRNHVSAIYYDGDYVTIQCDRQTALEYIQKIYEANKAWNREMIRMLMDVSGDDVKISFGGGGNSLVQDAMKETLESILGIEINQ